MLLGLDNSLVGRIPNTAWTVIFDNAFNYIKSGDSLIFSKTFQFTREAEYLLSDYVALYWEELIVNHTEQYVLLSQSNTEYDRAWILHFAWLSNPTITRFETDKIVNTLENLECSKNKKVAELSSEFLFRYETAK